MIQTFNELLKNKNTHNVNNYNEIISLRNTILNKKFLLSLRRYFIINAKQYF